MDSLPIQIADDLSVSIRDSSVKLTPAMAIDVAEALMRKGCRRLIDEEISARIEAAKQK
jgi:hypothetical protein